MSENELKEQSMQAATNEMQAVSDKIQTKDELLKVLKEDFSSGVTKVYVNSIGKEITFKEITVTQQKSLSRILIGNEQRKDIVYDAQCAMINTSALADGFDVYKLTEFDRLKILIALYQANMFNNNVKFTCKNCGAENEYKLNFDNVILRLDQIGLEPKTFEYDNKKYNFVFEVAYPNVRRISNFYKSYYMRNKMKSKHDIAANDSLSNMEYINLYIQKVKLTIKGSGAVRSIDMNDYKPSDVEDILAQFPQDALYTDNGVLSFIAKEYIKKMNESFDRHECYSCGTPYEEENANQVESFL